MNKFILIGIPNCGKTTLGRRAAEVLRLPFFDTDSIACEKLGIRHPFDQIRASLNGRFVNAQREAVFELSELDSAAVISTGAEVALIPACAMMLPRMGTIIHIQRNREAIFADLANEYPQLILEDMNKGTKIVMQEEAVRLYEKELSQYDALANHRLENNGSEDACLEKLIEIINQKQSEMIE